jgi:hypothetical protein
VGPDIPTYDVSPAVLRILMRTYRRDYVPGIAAGKRGRYETTWPPPGDLVRAVAAGVMFAEPRSLDHDGWVQAARQAAAAVSAREVGEAFLVSLTSRRMDLRSALGSYAVARLLPEHPYTEQRWYAGCAICGIHPSHRADGPAEPEDLNALSQQRFLGGSRLDTPPAGTPQHCRFDRRVRRSCCQVSSVS